MDSDFLRSVIQGATDSYRAGMDSGHVDSSFRAILAGQPDQQDDAKALLRTIVHAYDKCRDFENVSIPSALMAAIESARKVGA